MNKHNHNHEHKHEHEHHIYDESIHIETSPHACDGAGHEHHHHEDGTCCCELHAREYHGLDKKMLARLLIAGVLFIIPYFIPDNSSKEIIELVCYLLCALIAGLDIIFRAVKNLFHGKYFDEYFLMSFAAIVAFCISEYEEAAAVFLLYRIGAFCQSYAIRKSSNTISSKTGDWDLADHETEISTPFITKFAKIYTPIILILAVIISVVLPLIAKTSYKESIYRALSFLVLACPCAIVISVQLTYTAAIASATKKEIFVSNSKILDIIASKNGYFNNAELQYQTNSNSVYYFNNKQEYNRPDLIFYGSEISNKNEKEETLSKIAKKTKTIVNENVWFTIIIKISVLILSVCGVSSLWFAVFADSGVTIIAVLNSIRAFWNK